jgi:four helix bundle protein
MRNENVSKEKSMAFAIRIVNLYKYLCKEKKEFVMSKQILKSGTSIGANLAEAECAFSKKEFLAKVFIAYKECAETRYWLELLFKSEYLTKEEFDRLNDDCGGLFGILSAITKTTRARIKNEEFRNEE